MKFRFTAVILFLAFAAAAQSKKELAAEVAKLKAEIEQLKKPKEADLSSVQKKASYGIGVLIATNLKQQGGDSLDSEAIGAGLKDILTNSKLKIEKEQCSAIVQNYMQSAMDHKRVAMKREGEDFLKVNKTKEGVVTTASGLQYKIKKAGTGKSPLATDNVTVNYRGTTIDGVEFDSSEKSGKPASFNCGGVISGWTEALQLMHEGDQFELYIPYDLAYGERGSGSVIPPFATLIFNIELLKVN